MKKILIAALVVVFLLLAAVGAGIWWLIANKDELTRRITERTLAFVMEVDVSIASAELRVRDGSVRFNDIVISNPPGYTSSHAMRFGTVFVEADIASFRTDTPVIRMIEVRETDIILEAKVRTSNLQDIMNSSMRFAEEDPPEDAPDEVEKQYRIDRLVIAGSTVRVALPLAGGRTADVQLPDIEMEDLGGEDETVTPAEAVQEIVAVLIDRIRGQAGDILPTDLLAGIASDLDNLSDNLRGEIEGAIGRLRATGEEGDRLREEVDRVGEEVERAGQQVGEELERATESAEEAVRGFLGRRQ